MDNTTPADQAKQIRLSLFINICMAVYAICTFISVLKSGVAWRILLSGTGAILFTIAVVMMTLKLIKLRKAD